MRGKVLLTLAGGARRIIDPNQIMTYGEHSITARGNVRLKLCRVALRERNEQGEEELNEYDALLSASELRARLREAFLELGDQKSAKVFEEEPLDARGKSSVPKKDPRKQPRRTNGSANVGDRQPAKQGTRRKVPKNDVSKTNQGGRKTSKTAILTKDC